MTRRSSSGQPLGAEQVISVGEALRLFGPNAAWIDHQETAAGSITPGKRADLVVLGRDPREVESAEIGSIPVLATLIDGEPVYGSLPGN